MATTFKDYAGVVTGIEEQDFADDLSEEMEGGCSNCGLGQGTVAGSSAAMAGIAFKNTSAMASVLVAKASTELRTRLDPSRGLLPSKTLAQAGLGIPYGARHPQSARGLASSLLARTPVSLTEGLQPLSAQGLFEPVGTVSPVRDLGRLPTGMNTRTQLSAGPASIAAATSSLAAEDDFRCEVEPAPADAGERTEEPQGRSPYEQFAPQGRSLATVGLYEGPRVGPRLLGALGGIAPATGLSGSLIGSGSVTTQMGRDPVDLHPLSPSPYHVRWPSSATSPFVPQPHWEDSSQLGDKLITLGRTRVRCHLVLPYDSTKGTSGSEWVEGARSWIPQTFKNRTLKVLNRLFAPAILDFSFDPAADITWIDDPRLWYWCIPDVTGLPCSGPNKQPCRSGPNKSYRKSWLAGQPNLQGKLVYIFQKKLKPGGSPCTWRLAGGEAAIWSSYVTVPGNGLSDWTIAHETGHYLGLPHTKPAWSDGTSGTTQAEAQASLRQLIQKHLDDGKPPGEALSQFDGDRYANPYAGLVGDEDGLAWSMRWPPWDDDTPPEPLNAELALGGECQNPLILTVRGMPFTINPDFRNIMSYKSNITPGLCDSARITSGQANRILRGLLDPDLRYNRTDLYLALNDPSRIGKYPRTQLERLAGVFPPMPPLPIPF